MTNDNLYTHIGITIQPVFGEYLKTISFQCSIAIFKIFVSKMSDYS